MIKNTDKLIKVIVFDIDGTLLHRTVEKLANIQHHYSSNGRYIYLRPQIQQLILHFETLQKNARLVLWTSMMHKNAHKIYQHFNQIGLHFDKLYTQEHCL
jgi:hydroxymethylpyrimidine pyrophosphatase-like HAD family hydrolase